MKRICLALASTLVLALTFAACSEEEKKDDSECDCIGTGGGPGGAGGTDDGGAGGEGGGAGGEVQAEVCPYGGGIEFHIDSIEVPDFGNWPYFLKDTEGPDGMGGAGNGPGEDGVGCDWIDYGYYDSGNISCSGLVTLERDVDTPTQLVATFEDGSVAHLTVEGAQVPASGKADLALYESGVRDNPFGSRSSSSSTSAKDESGKLLWVIDHSVNNGGAEAYLGAPVTAVESCSAPFEASCWSSGTLRVFDHVVKTAPEQRIVAGERSVITTAEGSYYVSWYTSERTYDDPSVYTCADAGGPPSGRNDFGMVRMAAAQE